ncbi:hypothetical protein HY988_01010 [Candidatus Micrarchaeota archaeon]|nr:hypothetical protein [Candidatus Micrarchaeota archaeon]
MGSVGLLQAAAHRAAPPIAATAPGQSVAFEGDQLRIETQLPQRAAPYSRSTIT